ncbi:MAG TPA: TcpQ domain-containing protein [Castellaniella sp.]|nr:TcpQ domain-containing protein [Castellaniella sp.]
MIRFILAAGLALGLAGCASTDGGAWWREFAGLAPATGRYDFGWRLSGDPDLAPLQVFDDGRETWLQYPAAQPAPAVFVRTAAGDRLTRPRRDGDYLVVRGVPDHLVMRGGLLSAHARRQAGRAADPVLPGGAGQGATPTAVAALSAETLAGPAVVPAPADKPAPVLPVPAASTALTPTPAAPAPRVPRPPSPAPTRPAAGAAPVPAAPIAVSARVPRPEPAPVSVRSTGNPAAPAPAAEAFEVTPADGNVRRALARWARLAGWTFEAEHWAVDADIPLAGSAVFNEPFRAAVRGLLAATELGDRPVQPCFYANRVLRVVPLAQRCDRTQAPGESA